MNNCNEAVEVDAIGWHNVLYIGQVLHLRRFSFQRQLPSKRVNRWPTGNIMTFIRLRQWKKTIRIIYVFMWIFAKLNDENVVQLYNFTRNSLHVNTNTIILATTNIIDPQNERKWNKLMNCLGDKLHRELFISVGRYLNEKGFDSSSVQSNYLWVLLNVSLYSLFGANGVAHVPLLILFLKFPRRKRI